MQAQQHVVVAEDGANATILHMLFSKAGVSATSVWDKVLSRGPGKDR